MTHGEPTYPLETTSLEPVDVEKDPSGQKALAVRDLDSIALMQELLEEVRKVRIGLELFLGYEIK